jgi:hypothetical protein
LCFTGLFFLQGGTIFGKSLMGYCFYRSRIITDPYSDAIMPAPSLSFGLLPFSFLQPFSPAHIFFPDERPEEEYRSLAFSAMLAALRTPRPGFFQKPIIPEWDNFTP